MAPERGLTQVCRLTGHEDRVWYAAWRPNVDPPQLTTCGADRMIRMWGVRGSSSLDSEDAWVLLSEMDAAERHSRTLRSVGWDMSGGVMAVASFDATTTLWREAKGEDGPGGAGEVRSGLNFECVGTVAGHENEVKSAMFSPSGDFLATCSRDKSVWIFETAANFEYECISLLQSHSQDVKCVRWHPSQDVLFSCSYDDTVKIWAPDGDDWSCKETLVGHASTVWGLAFDPAGARFATCSDDRTLRVWAPASSAAAVAAEKKEQAQKQASPPAAGGASASSQAWGGYHLAAAAFVSPLFRFSTLPAAAATEAAGATAPPASADAAAAAPAEPAEDGSAPPEPPPDAACAWRCVGAVEGLHPRPIYSVDWLGFPTAASTSCLATACGDNRVRVLRPGRGGADSGDWACVGDVEAHTGDVNCVAWCPKALGDGSALLASVGDDCEVALWRFAG